jgi:hypothetical protein
VLVRLVSWFLAASFCIVPLACARAVPAFAEQTGQPCQACHIGGFGPQLTPFGRAFKLNAYAMRVGESFTPPVSAMAIASFVNTQKDQNPPPAPHFAPNNNFAIDQVSVFIAGGDGDHFGGFSQFTYDGIGQAISWDNLDLRAIDHATLWGSDLLYGLSFNNNPTVQDPWNTTAAWGYPFTSSALGPSPAAAPLVSGAFAGNTLGMSVYGWWDSEFYTEAGIYWTPGSGFLRTLGASADAGVIDGAALYLRAAYQKDYGDQNFEVGAFAMFPNVHPAGVGGTMTDDYADIGVDGSYQYLGDGTNIVTIDARYTHEHQSLGASVAAGNAANLHNTLDDLRLDASYIWQNTLGLTVAPFTTWGSHDAGLYSGNPNFSPDSDGVTLEADYTLFPNSDSSLGERFNIKVGLQYTAYGKFNGSAAGAADNNTLRIFTWVAY